MAIVALLMGGMTGMTAFVISLFMVGLPLGAAAQVYFLTGFATIFALLSLRFACRLCERVRATAVVRTSPALVRRR